MNWVDPTGHMGTQNYDPSGGYSGHFTDETPFEETAVAKVGEAVEAVGESLHKVHEACQAVLEDCDQVLEFLSLYTGTPEFAMAVESVGAARATNALLRGALAESESALAARSDWAYISGMLRDAARGKGMFGIGSATAEQAEVLGRAWVGEGAVWSSDGTALVSADGLRQYRPPSWKKDWGTIQANLEWRNTPKGPWGNNAHITVIYGPTP